MYCKLPGACRLLVSCPPAIYQRGSHSTYFREIWHWRLWWKFVEKIQIWLKSSKHIGHCTLYLLSSQATLNRHTGALFRVKWYQATRTAEEVQTLRERAIVWRCAYTILISNTTAFTRRTNRHCLVNLMCVCVCMYVYTHTQFYQRTCCLTATFFPSCFLVSSCLLRSSRISSRPFSLGFNRLTSRFQYITIGA